MSNPVSISNTRVVNGTDLVRAVGQVLLAPFRVFAWILRAGYRAGFFVLFQAPVAAMGLLFTVCAGVVVTSWLQQLYEYPHQPALQIRSKEVALGWARQIDQGADAQRRARGLPPQPVGDRKAPPIEADLDRLRAEVTAQARSVAATP